MSAIPTIRLSIRQAMDEFFQTVVPSGHSALMRSNPGIGKSTVAASTARAIVREQGGVFLGWEAGDQFIQANPPSGQPFKLVGDPRAPKVQSPSSGKPFLVYRHTVMTGSTQLDLQGATVPVDTLPYIDPDNPAITQPTEVLSLFARGFVFQGMPDTSTYSVLVLDEALKDKALLPKIASLTHGGRIGDHRLPGDLNSVLLLANYSTSRANNVEPTLDVIDRCWICDVGADEEGVKSILRSMKAPAWAVAFAARNVGADIVFDSPVPREGTSYASPRSYEHMIRLLMTRERNTNKPTDPEDPVIQSFVFGKIGREGGARLLDVIRLGPMLPSMQEILNDPQNAKLPDKRADAQIFLVEVLSKAADLANFSPLCSYVKRLSNSPRALFVNAIASRHAHETERRRQGLTFDQTPMNLMMSQEKPWQDLFDGSLQLRRDNRG